MGAIVRVPRRPGVVVDTGMCGRSLLGNREILWSDTYAALLTCQMRGWVEPLQHAVPSAQLTPEGALPRDMSFDKTQTLYRLTSAGWLSSTGLI
jgi:hypothetical protein